MPKFSKTAEAALVRQHGEEGARYLENLRRSSDNPYLQKAIEEIEREAEASAATGRRAS